MQDGGISDRDDTLSSITTLSCVLLHASPSIFTQLSFSISRALPPPGQSFLPPTLVSIFLRIQFNIEQTSWIFKMYTPTEYQLDSMLMQFNHGTASLCSRMPLGVRILTPSVATPLTTACTSSPRGRHRCRQRRALLEELACLGHHLQHRVL